MCNFPISLFSGAHTGLCVSVCVCGDWPLFKTLPTRPKSHFWSQRKLYINVEKQARKVLRHFRAAGGCNTELQTSRGKTKCMWEIAIVCAIWISRRSGRIYCICYQAAHVAMLHQLGWGSVRERNRDPINIPLWWKMFSKSCCWHWVLHHK